MPGCSRGGRARLGPQGVRGPRAGAREVPWWLVILAGAGAIVFARVLSDPVQAGVLRALLRGVWVTGLVTVTAFAMAAALGLGLALAGRSGPAPVRHAVRIYVEVMRGLPILVLLLYVAFVLAPALVEGWNRATAPFGFAPLRSRDLPLLWRAVLALTLAYSAFLSEVFRAGLASVDRGQVEAALALGLSRWRRFRHVVLPQAFRTMLPPLGNDLVAMVKDSSLVSVLGVADVTQLGKVLAAGNFRYFETYNVVALIYLTLTIGLSLALRGVERRLRARGHLGEAMK